MNIYELPTPALLLDADLFEENIRKMAAHAAAAGKHLRPHAKAHKCVNIAKRQLQAGAVGVCVATVSEAELMVRAGVNNILLTSPIADQRKCQRMAALAGAANDITVVVDHARQAEMYSQAAVQCGSRLNMLVDLDVGDHRTGIHPGQPALQLARTILGLTGLAFQGLQAYSAKASHMTSEEGGPSFSAEALQAAADTKALLEAGGIPAPTLTGGSTGSYSADSQLPYMTELQTGSYALMDVAYARIGVTEFRHAMTVIATVVSANYHDRVTIDAGFKAFATDRPFGPELVHAPGAKYQWAGDEFGYLFLDEGAQRPSLGDRLRLIPPHCDPTVNLYDRIHVCQNDIVLETWSVMDRYQDRHHAD